MAVGSKIGLAAFGFHIDGDGHTLDALPRRRSCLQVPVLHVTKSPRACIHGKSNLKFVASTKQPCSLSPHAACCCWQELSNVCCALFISLLEGRLHTRRA
jgi:hypothetical protein